MSIWELPENVEKRSIESTGSYLIESGLYDAVVTMAYLNQNMNTKAVHLNMLLKLKDGREFRESGVIRSSTEKGNKTYSTGKDGVNRPLPMYSLGNSLCVAAAQESLAACIGKAEKKVIKVYDYDAQKEVNKEMPVLVSILNKPVKVAIQQTRENKRAQIDGKWTTTNDDVHKNNARFFGLIDGRSAEEYTRDEPASIMEKWAERNTGTVVDKYKPVEKSESAAGIMGDGFAADTGADLF